MAGSVAAAARTSSRIGATGGATSVDRRPRRRMISAGPAALRIMPVVARPVSPAMARQAATALTMDTTDMTWDAAAVHRQFPSLHRERLEDVIRQTLMPSDPAHRVR
jgi:hypothetical protein